MGKENGTHVKRPSEITSESIFLGIIGVLAVFFSIILFWISNGNIEAYRFLISITFGLFFLILSYGLWNGKSWAYISFVAVIIFFTYFLVSDIVEVVFAHKDIGILTLVKWAFFVFIIVSEVKDMRKPQIKEYLHITS